MKKRVRFSLERSKLSQRSKNIKHPPAYYLGRKKPGLALFELLVKKIKRK